MSGGYFLFIGGSTVTLRFFFFLEGCEEIQEESKMAGATKPLPGRKSLLAQSQKDQLVKLVFAGRGTEVVTIMTDTITETGHFMPTFVMNCCLCRCIQLVAGWRWLLPS